MCFIESDKESISTSRNSVWSCLPLFLGGLFLAFFLYFFCLGSFRYFQFYRDTTSKRKELWPSIFLSPPVSTKTERENYNRATDPKRLLFILKHSKIKQEKIVCDQRLRELSGYIACLDPWAFLKCFKSLLHFSTMREETFQMYLSLHVTSLTLSQRIKIWEKKYGACH